MARCWLPAKTCWTIRAAPRELADELVEPAAKALSGILELDYAETLEKFSVRTSNDCLLRRRAGREMTDAVRAWCQEHNAQGIQIPGRIPAASTRREILWADCWALPM